MISRLTPGIGFYVIYYIHNTMELASLRKRTKAGISVWRFVYDEESLMHYAVGGEVLKVIPCDDRGHLRKVFDNFKRYGYAEKLPTEQMWLDDPWASDLPATMQQELELLAA